METDGTVELDGSSSQDLPTDTYNSLKINNAAGIGSRRKHNRKWNTYNDIR